MSIVGVGLAESRPNTVFRAISMFRSIIHVFGHAK